ncbi:MAG TPA: DNA polymerase III subunit delta' [Roseiarcus sp.]|jgi:DNA polymerase-3 subunit delta'
MSKAPADAPPESDAFPGARHPRHAAGLVGHAGAEAAILDAYREGRLAHAWLIGGREGVGKATLAWRFARFVLANPDPYATAVQTASNLAVSAAHPAARQLAALSHPDFALTRREWNPKSKSHYTEIRVEDLRAGLAMFHMSAAFGGWRVAIVDSAEDLNRSGANSLLKLIEEPPPRSLILIIAHRPGQVLPTIRSRCRRLLLDRLSPREIDEVIGGLGPPWSSASAEARAEAAERADGSVREALRRLDPDAMSVGALIDGTIAQLPNADPRAVHKLADAVSGRAASDAFEAFTNALYDWLAARARAQETPPAAREALTTLWNKIRAATRETEALNLDRRLHVLAVFEEIAARSRVL